MGKARVIAIAYVLCMFVIFFLMLYLMTTVNPPPIPIPNVPDSERAVEVHEYNNMLKNDAVMVPGVDTARFGLQKADEIDFFHSTIASNPKYNSIENITRVFRFKPRKIIPPIWPRHTHIVVTDPTVHIVSPSIWPSSLEKMDTKPPGSIKVTVNESLNVDIPKDKTQSKTNKTTVKSMKRRSINNNEANKNSGSVILKILDTEAKSRIEIKLGSDMFFNEHQPQKIMDLIGHNSKFTIQSEISQYDTNINNIKDTIITIMPNEFVIIDQLDVKPVLEKEYKDIKDLINSLVSIEEDSEENKELPLLEDNLSPKLIFANNNSYTSHIDNRSIRKLCNSSDVNETGTNVTTKNRTDFDTMAYIKINTTEFDKKIFEEEKTKNDPKERPNFETQFYTQ